MASTIRREAPARSTAAKAVAESSPLSRHVEASVNRDDARRALRLTRGLDPLLREALVRGVADRRGPSSLASQGVLGSQNVRTIVSAVAQLSPALRERLDALLRRTGGREGSDPLLERALILKALAAQRPRLSEFPSEVMEALERFATLIRGAQRSRLASMTTLVGTTPRRTPDGLPVDLRRRDGFSSSGALIQYYRTTCTKAVAQLIAGREDPIYALAIRSDQLAGLAENGRAAREQIGFFRRVGQSLSSYYDELNRFRPVHLDSVFKLDDPNLRSYLLEGRLPRRFHFEHALESPLRSDLRARACILRSLAGALTRGELTSDDEREIIERLGGVDPLSPRAQQWLGAHLDELDAIDSVRRAWGDGAHYDDALRALVTPRTGLEYRYQPFPDCLPAMAARLRVGTAVPLYVAKPAEAPGTAWHAMLMHGLRENGPDLKNAQFLVTDPVPGNTAWLTYRELLEDARAKFTYKSGPVAGYFVDGALV